MYNSWKKFPEQCFAITLINHFMQYKHKFFISLMHVHSAGQIGPCQVHAVYTMHT